MAAREEEVTSMARPDPGSRTTVIPILRDDGTVYFQYAGKSLTERVCDWTLAFLCFLVLAIIATTATLVILA
jgi:hypothetical protein